jgi:hypothetical protein
MKPLEEDGVADKVCFPSVRRLSTVRNEIPFNPVNGFCFAPDAKNDDRPTGNESCLR